MTTTIRAGFVAKRLHEMHEAKATAMTMANGFMDGDFWHRGVKPNDCKALADSPHEIGYIRPGIHGVAVGEVGFGCEGVP